MARTSSYTEETASYIIEKLSQGIPLAEICREDGMPGLSTVYDWQKVNEEFAGRFARAREAGFDQIALDALKIADRNSEDYIPDADGNLVLDREHVQRSKLRIETRLKLLAKWDPKRYGDRIELDNKHSGQVGFALNIHTEPK